MYNLLAATYLKHLVGVIRTHIVLQDNPFRAVRNFDSGRGALITTESQG